MPEGTREKKSPKDDFPDNHFYFYKKNTMPDIYPENFEVKTGFDKVREMLKSKCLTLSKPVFTSKFSG